MSLLDRHSKLTMQGVTGVVWVPIAADVLFNFVGGPLNYTKNAGGVFNAFFYRNHPVVAGKRVRMQKILWDNDFCGFYNPALVNVARWQNMDYGFQAKNAPQDFSQAIERGVLKFTSGVGTITGNEVMEVRKTATAQYVTDGGVVYNSLQNFVTGFYGATTATTGDSIDNAEIVI